MTVVVQRYAAAAVLVSNVSLDVASWVMGGSMWTRTSTPPGTR